MNLTMFLLFNELNIKCRLAGVALVVPFVNYWWSCYPAKLSEEALGKMLPQDQRSFRVAHYAPWLVHWWMNQKWFRGLSITEGNMAIFSPPDLEMVKQLSSAPSPGQVSRRTNNWNLISSSCIIYIDLFLPLCLIFRYVCIIVPKSKKHYDVSFFGSVQFLPSENITMIF